MHILLLLATLAAAIVGICVYINRHHRSRDDCNCRTLTLDEIVDLITGDVPSQYNALLAAKRESEYITNPYQLWKILTDAMWIGLFSKISNADPMMTIIRP